MKKTVKLPEHTAVMIAEVHNYLRAAHTLCREINTDIQSPQGLVTEFTAIGSNMQINIDRITRRIPDCRIDAFNNQIATADPLGFENIKMLWFNLPAEKKELIENTMLLASKGVDFELTKK